MFSGDAKPRGATASPSERAHGLRLTAADSFRLAYREGIRISDDLLVIYVRPNGAGERRVGIAIPRRVGPAVRRNRLKRRLREASRMAASTLPEGTDAVIVPRLAAEGAHVVTLQESLRALFNRAAGPLR